MPKIYPLKEEERLPEEFWEDQRWALEHYRHLRNVFFDYHTQIAFLEEIE